MNIYDIETYEEKQKVIPYCICFYINNTYSYIYKTKSDIIIDFLNEIVKKTEIDIVLFSHNINFDGMLIIESLTKNNIYFEWFMREMNIYWIEINYLKIKIKLRCSYKLIPLSVSILGNYINTPKQVFPYKFVKFETINYIGLCPNEEFFNTKNEYFFFIKENKIFDLKKKTIEYCYNDIKIILEVLSNISKIINQYNKKILNTSYSFSSIAYKLFSKKFDIFEICNITTSLEIHEYSKKSYFGGRCEVFGNPNDNEIIHHFDFSGMYAYCMKSNKFPIGNPVFKTTNLNYTMIGLHTVKVKSDLKIPLLPIKHNKKLIFPNGEFVGTYTHNDLKYFKELGGEILMHYSSLEYDKEDYVFKDYIEEFDEIRKKGIYYKIFGKAMNNGLYGSFALNEDNSIFVITFSEEELYGYIKNMNVLSWKKVNNTIIIKIEKNKSSSKFFDKKKKWNSTKRNIIYSSYISSYARNRLYNSFLEVEKSGGRLYYTDTDSIFAGYKTNNIGRKVGEIEWTDIYEDGVFISPKFYYLKNQTLKSKGVKNNTFIFEDIKKMFYLNQEILEFENQLQFKKENFILIQKYITKKININSYNKRIFSENKKNTKSLIIHPD